MKQDTRKTKVTFYKNKIYGGILAYFNNELFNWYDKKTKVCYSHLGQHSSCAPDYVRLKCIKAIESEYKDLKSELESIGYNLTVLNEKVKK